MKKYKTISKHFNIEVGKVLKNARKQKHLTQEQLSNMTDIPRHSIAKYETGSCSLPLENFLILCDVLELDSNTCLKGIKYDR